MVLLTRNLNFPRGLVKGPKVIVRDVSRRAVQLELLNNARSIILLPRVKSIAKFVKNDRSFPRLTSLLRECFTGTIDKYKGQTLFRIGLDLRSQSSIHGQLYVSLTRATVRSSVICLRLPCRSLSDRAIATHSCQTSPTQWSRQWLPIPSLPRPPLLYHHFIRYPSRDAPTSSPDITQPNSYDLFLDLHARSSSQPIHQRQGADGGEFETKGHVSLWHLLWHPLDTTGPASCGDHRTRSE